MSKATYPINQHDAYHAHVYFDGDSGVFASQLRDSIQQVFPLKVGRFHGQPVGPHPVGSFQVIFGRADFSDFVPWLDSNRGELSVLIHALTGDDLKDHTDYTYWLGKPWDLNLALFKKTD
ncbi:DOPA 4,5-dioxygenase family protein [Microbulbifer agarilyticus]|uniref:DOPA 4,5-dioxygenase family protein n=1 Tax=Microbulbifer agarilyticus TaxID=260552 RepID=UPI001CD69B8A|nr:DOPA 4,5-dioxygenase family protein [Microbulbifer agarilyticus]MCA0901930.1 DOPA 4,5-dioxygenase family protein [Microbulbifer agarilyticus]